MGQCASELATERPKRRVAAPTIGNRRGRRRQHATAAAANANAVTAAAAIATTANATAPREPEGPRPPTSPQLTAVVPEPGGTSVNEEVLDEPLRSSLLPGGVAPPDESSTPAEHASPNLLARRPSLDLRPAEATPAATITNTSSPRLASTARRRSLSGSLSSSTRPAVNPFAAPHDVPAGEDPHGDDADDAIAVLTPSVGLVTSTMASPAAVALPMARAHEDDTALSVAAEPSCAASIVTNVSRSRYDDKNNRSADEAEPTSCDSGMQSPGGFDDNSEEAAVFISDDVLRALSEESKRFATEAPTQKLRALQGWVAELPCSAPRTPDPLLATHVEC
jgi:hypothetical protein